MNYEQCQDVSVGICPSISLSDLLLQSFLVEGLQQLVRASETSVLSMLTFSVPH